jgi:AcrR family transcriptional regulator
MLENGTSLLNALVANPDGGGSASEDVIVRLLDRLNNLTGRAAAANSFLRDFSRALPGLSPSENLESDFLALVSAFIGVDAALPRVIPNEPSAEFRERVDPAFEELDRAWGALGITC